MTVLYANNISEESKVFFHPDHDFRYAFLSIFKLSIVFMILILKNNWHMIVIFFHSILSQSFANLIIISHFLPILLIVV